MRLNLSMFPKNINNKPWNKWIDRLGGLEELGSRFTRRKKGEGGRLEGGIQSTDITEHVYACLNRKM